MSPLIVRWQFNWVSYFFIPSIELNLNGFWTKTILVVGIFPFLRDFHLCQSWFMRIGQDNIGLVLIIYRYFVTIWDSYFFDCICNCFSGCLGIKVFKCTFPVIRCWKFYHLIRRNTIFVQLNLNASWAQTILVICIFPFLAHFYFGLFWFVRIGHDYLTWIRCFDSLCVAFWNIDFFYCIVDNLASFLLV